jgi:hypothetical protein
MENINIGSKECPFIEICYDEMDNDEDQIYRESMKRSIIEEWDSFNERCRVESMIAENDIESMQQYRAYSESEENRGSMYSKNMSLKSEDHLISEREMTTMFDESKI